MILFILLIKTAPKSVSGDQAILKATLPKAGRDVDTSANRAVGVGVTEEGVSNRRKKEFDWEAFILVLDSMERLRMSWGGLRDFGLLL